MGTQRLGRHQSDVYPGGYAAMRQANRYFGTQRSRPMFEESRPFSWHPSSQTDEQLYQPEQPSMFEPVFPTMYETMDINGLPTPMIQPEMNNVPVEQWFSLDGQNIYTVPPVPAQNTTTPPQDFNPFAQTDFFSSNMAYDYGLGASDISSYQQFYNPSTSNWMPSAMSYALHTAPATPNLLPIQKPNNADLLETPAQQAVSLSNNQSAELVGMGLHDKPEATSSFLFDGPSHARPESTGRGLKLEDAWEPPEESNEEDEDEEDTDENPQDEMMEDESQQMMPQEADFTLAPTDMGLGPYMNLSDKSFFFDDSEVLPGEEFAMPVNSYDWAMMVRLGLDA